MVGRTIGVVGAGNMGAGIAQKTASEGFDVVLVDLNEEAARKGHERMRATIAEGLKRGVFTEQMAHEIAERVRPSGRLEDVAQCQLVVEAVFEDLSIKQELFAKLDEICRPEAILATNTSSFTVKDVANATQRPDRVVGLHYFYHPAKNRLVEVIAGEDTAEETHRSAWIFAESTGKTPIRSADSPGFVVNRYFVPWVNEAVRLLEEGVADIPTIEAAAKESFRIGMGPFELMNVTGIPIALHAATTLGNRLGQFYAPAARLAEQVHSRELWPLEGPPDASRFQAVRERLLGVTFLVAAQMVDQGVCSIEDADIGARVGLRWAWGPFELMNRVGLAGAARLAGELAGRWKELSLPRLLEERAADGKPFEFRRVRLRVEEGIAEILLNRPDAMNALNAEVIAQLEKAFDEAERRGDVATILLRGAGKAFVAGADVKFFLRNLDAGELSPIRAFTERAQSLYRRIDESSKLVVCRLDGLSLGGGAELALCADVILATEKGSMGFPETGIGIYPGLGGTQRTPRRIGVPLARWLILTGTVLDARTAAAIGLIDEVLPLERMDERVRELHRQGRPPARRKRELPREFAELEAFFREADVEELLAGTIRVPQGPLAKEVGKLRCKAPAATRIADELIRTSLQGSLAEGLERELSHLEEIFRTRDAYEGLSSLGRKRPVFRGE